MLNFSDLAPFSVECSTPLEDDINCGTTAVSDGVAITTYQLPGHVEVSLEYPVDSLSDLIRNHNVYRVTVRNEHVYVVYVLRGVVRKEYPEWALVDAYMPHKDKDTIESHGVIDDARVIKVCYDKDKPDGFYTLTLTRN